MSRFLDFSVFLLKAEAFSRLINNMMLRRLDIKTISLGSAPPRVSESLQTFQDASFLFTEGVDGQKLADVQFP